MSVHPQPFQPVAKESCRHPCSTQQGRGRDWGSPFPAPCKELGGLMGYNPPGRPWVQQAPWVPGAALTSFALAGGVQVVAGAQQLALAVDAAVVDAGREVGAQVHLGCHIGAGLEPVAQEKALSPRPAPLEQLLPPAEAPLAPRLGRRWETLGWGERGNELLWCYVWQLRAGPQGSVCCNCLCQAGRAGGMRPRLDLLCL